MTRWLKFTLYPVLFILLFGSCKSLDTFFPGVVEREMNARELIKAIDDNALDYQHLFFRRAFVEFKQNGKSQAVRANIYIRKDSAIIVSVIPVMGIEMYRLKLSKDEIIVLDRINRKLIRSDYESLSQRFLFDFYFLQFQQILSNGVFVFPDGHSSLRGFEMQRDSSSYLFSSGLTQDGSMQEFRFMPEVYRLLSTEVQYPDRHIMMELEYSDFFMVEDGFLFPSLIFMEGQRLQENITLSIQLSSIEVDGSQRLNFSIPSGYDEVDF